MKKATASTKKATTVRPVKSRKTGKPAYKAPKAVPLGKTGKGICKPGNEPGADEHCKTGRKPGGDLDCGNGASIYPGACSRGSNANG